MRYSMQAWSPRYFKLCKMATDCSPVDKDEEKLVPRLLRDHVKFPTLGLDKMSNFLFFPTLGKAN
jgi:hypothetical protein